MHYSSFSVGRLPEIRFGPGRFDELPDIAASFGRRGVLVTGAGSLAGSGRAARLDEGLARLGITCEPIRIDDEPTPATIDEAVARLAPFEPEFVLAVGGGSAMDAGKAIAGLLPSGRPVLDFLEGVGKGEPYPGRALPLVAAPTTAGTGSEATKNAVLGVRGADGYKKSFRDDALVARVAVVDPDVLATCPPHVIAANGMDALTQLLEGFVSTRASPFTDALASDGLAAIRDGLPAMYRSSAADPLARSRMAWAALASGMVLAQAGLGSVHGLASPLGAFFPIPHGVACGTLLAEATRINLRALAARDRGGAALDKYRRAAALLLGREFERVDEACSALVERLSEWTDMLGMERLSRYGVRESDVTRLVAGARGNSMRTNPIVLHDEEIAELVSLRL